MDVMCADESKWLPIEEAAERIGQHPGTVRRKVRDGLIEGIRLGNHGPFRIRESALAAHLHPVHASEEQ